MVQCPICGFTGNSFDDYGRPLRASVLCPSCRSLERHRLIWLFLQRNDLLDRRMNLLHFAPEPCFRGPFSQLLGENYITANIEPGKESLTVDIAAMPEVPTASFDAVMANHVLEHVHEDRRAMAEIRRVMRPDGWALITVPYNFDRLTEEEDPDDPYSPEEREMAFGQLDHVRYYGMDVIDRLREAGMSVASVELFDDLSADERALYRVERETIFFCRHH